mgnify:CR=1 FL=1
MKFKNFLIIFSVFLFFSGCQTIKEKTDLIAAKWTALVKTASLQADFYNLDNGSILVNIVKPWFFDGIMKFLAQQPETVKITKDQKDYYPKDILDDDDEWFPYKLEKQVHLELCID